MKNNKNIFDEKLDLLDSLDSDVEIIKEEKVEDDEVILLPPKQRNTIYETEKKGLRVVYDIFAFICLFALVGVLLLCVTSLPIFGDMGSNGLLLNEIVIEYLDPNGHYYPEATNYVTGLILDYRAFDTLGESFVLFTAVTCVMILLQNFKDEDEPQIERIKLFNDRVLRYSAAIIVPIIILFGFYVILNGSISPGGGFSGGAIVGAGLILYSLAFGVEKTAKFFNINTFKTITSISLLTYCGCKAVSFLSSYLPYHIDTFGTPGNIFSGGFIFILNCCVGLVVACTMCGFYLLFKKGEI